MDERALDVLLMAAPADGGMRTVRKTGVHLDRHAYVDPELQRWVGRQVQVRLDEEDMGRVLVLDRDGGFIAWALNPDLAGISRPQAAAVMSAAMNQVIRHHQAKVRESKKAVRTAMPEILADAIRRAEEKDAKILPFPKAAEAHVTPALETAAEALERKPAAARRKPLPPAITEAQVLALETAKPLEPKRRETAVDRFLRWEVLDARLKAGEVLNEAEARRWRGFQQDSEFEAITDLIKDRGREAVLGGAGAVPSAG